MAKDESLFRGFFARTRCDLVAQWLQSQIYSSSNFLVSMLAETDLRVAFWRFSRRYRNGHVPFALNMACLESN